jgi:hypothetical protein
VLILSNAFDLFANLIFFYPWLKFRWLSGGELKQVALFGCPSVERRTVMAAKCLRSFFRIEENTVRLISLTETIEVTFHRVVMVFFLLPIETLVLS